MKIEESEALVGSTSMQKPKPKNSLLTNAEERERFAHSRQPETEEKTGPVVPGALVFEDKRAEDPRRKARIQVLKAAMREGSISMRAIPRGTHGLEMSEYGVRMPTNKAG